MLHSRAAFEPKHVSFFCVLPCFAQIDSLYDTDDLSPARITMRRTQSTEHADAVLDYALKPLNLKVAPSNLDPNDPNKSLMPSQLRKGFTSTKNVIGGPLPLTSDLHSISETQKQVNPVQLFEIFLSQTISQVKSVHFQIG